MTFLNWWRSDDGLNEEGGKSQTCLLGVASDLGTDTNSAGQALGPRALRLCYSLDLNWFGCVDAGDVVPVHRDIEDLSDIIATEVTDLVPNTDRLVVIGGDDSINYGVLKGHDVRYVVHLDAHPDDDTGPLNHSTWVRRVVEDGHAESVLQVGNRVMGRHPQPAYPPSMRFPYWLAIDLDVVDPAFAPGVGCPEPFGWTSTMLLQFLQTCLRDPLLVGVSFTELLAAKDINDITARLLARLVIECATLRP